jgi:hypothetical protein
MWSAAAERSDDAAFGCAGGARFVAERPSVWPSVSRSLKKTSGRAPTAALRALPKRRRRCALPPHSTTPRANLCASFELNARTAAAKRSFPSFFPIVPKLRVWTRTLSGATLLRGPAAGLFSRSATPLRNARVCAIRLRPVHRPEPGNGVAGTRACQDGVLARGNDYSNR